MKYLIKAVKKNKNQTPLVIMSSNDKKKIDIEFSIQKDTMFVTGLYSFVWIFEKRWEEYVMIERFQEGKPLDISI